MPDVNKLDLSGPENVLIAEASSHAAEDDYQLRWTDLEVYYRPGLRPRFVAQSVGVSAVSGETERVRRLAGSTLSKVLRMFAGIDGGEPTPLGKTVIAQAEAWYRDRAFDGRSIGEALAWLYEGMDCGEAYATRAARDFGTSNRPWQKALSAEADTDQPANVTVPLLAVLPYLDREAFQDASAERAAAARDAA